MNASNTIRDAKTGGNQHASLFNNDPSRAIVIALAATAALATAQSEAFAQDEPLEGKTIGVTVIGTDHHWDLMAYRGAATP